MAGLAVFSCLANGDDVSNLEEFPFLDVSNLEEFPFLAFDNYREKSAAKLT